MPQPSPPALALEQQRLALLAQIPAEELRHFEDYYQGQLALALQRAHVTAASSAGGAADPDEVERQLIDHLLREAEGRDHPHGLGAVPISNNLLTDLIPPASDPRDAPASPRERSWASLGRRRLLALAGVLVVALALLLTSLRGDERAEVAAARQPTATSAPRPATPTTIPTAMPQEAVEVSFPTSLEFARRDQTTTIVHVAAVAGQLGGMWQPDLHAERAAWLNDSFINTVICLPRPSALVAELERGGEIVMHTASGVRRRYEVARVREVGRQATEVLDQRRAGMTLLVCATGENTRTVVETIYRPSAAALAPASAGVAPAALVQHPIPLGKVRVIAEPVGCVYAAMLTDNGEIVDDVYRRGSVAVVDLGHGTVDTAVVTQLVTDQASLTTYQLGTVRPLTQLQQWLSGRTEVDFALHQVEGAVRTGQLHLAGRDEPLPDGWERPFAENGRLIAAKLEQSWGKGRQFDAIVLGGGGAEILLLVAAIRDRFPHAAVIAEPQLAIARGYARYGRYLLNQQGT